VVPSRVAWKYRAALGAGFIAHGDHVLEVRAPFDHRRDRLCRVGRKVEPGFAHGFDHDRIQFSGFDARTLGVKAVTRDPVEERLGHLAAGAIMDTNEKDVPFQRGLVQCSLLMIK